MTRRRPRGGRRGKAAPVASARRAALQALAAVEAGRSARLEPVLDVGGLDPRDVGLAWELALGAERAHLWLDFVLGRFVDRAVPKDPFLRSVLRLGLYQLLELSRVPAHAVVHETVGLAGHHRGFVNAVLRRVAGRVLDRAADPTAPRREIPLPEGPGGARCLEFAADVLPEPGTPAFLACRDGLPGFVVERWVEAFGYADADMVCTASRLPARLVLRPTRLAPPGGLAAALAGIGVVTAPTGIDELLVVESGTPFRGAPFDDGWFIAQDPTAWRAARAVGAQAGERVLDLCAAPGTKTTVLAEAVGEAGHVDAFDADPRRRPRIVENLERLQLAARVSVLERIEAQGYDRVLVDAPCSNTGVLGRRVEVRRRLSPAGFTELAARQRGLLAQGLDLCRPGGTVTYSTCSIEPDENRAVVDAVCAARPGCAVVTDCLTLPEPEGCDGGYFATIRLPDGG